MAAYTSHENVEAFEKDAVHVSVVVPTRNRPNDVRRCLESLSRVQYVSWSVVLVDQSDDDRTKIVAQSFVHRLPHLDYRHMLDRGASRARNAGIAYSTGDIIAFLDDDCTVTDVWLQQVTEAFRRHPQAALAFGAVKGAPHDPKECFIPSFPIQREQVIRGKRAFLRPDGMSASMYLRRPTARQVGLFDALLGPGTQFSYGGEDNDYVYRCLVSGYSVLRTPSIVTQHYGSRDYKSGAATRLFQGYAYCAGATDLKLLRSGHPIALVLMMSHLLYFLARTNWVNLILQRGPSNAERIVFYIRGGLASLRLKVDRRKRLFEGRIEPAAGRSVA